MSITSLLACCVGSQARNERQDSRLHGKDGSVAESGAPLGSPDEGVTRRLLVALAAGVLGVGQADAVTLSARGIGQVLIYPYYTANAGFGTLLSVVNTTARGKALKVRFHEGRNGRVVAAFNLYLSPFDVWVGEVFDSSGGGGDVALATYDASCTVPAFLVPVDPGPAPRLFNFSTAAFTGVHADGGPGDMARAHEGYFDVIEMGEVTNATHGSLTALSHVDGVPANCTQLATAWANGGYWASDATNDLAAPGGGLYGAESIIDVAQGTIYMVNAVAIDGFGSAAQHTAPAAAAPDLDTATVSADGSVSAYVPFGARLLEARFTKSVDAISALFISDEIFNEYVIDASIGARTDWIVTFPTKRFYTDPALFPASATMASAPFDEIFGATHAGASCAPAEPEFWNREELTTTTFGCGFLCPTLPPSGLCYAANVAPIGTAESTLGSQLLYLPQFNGGYYIDPLATGFRSGHMRFELTLDVDGQMLASHALSSNNGLTFKGLPALGFAAIDYVNANVTPGVLANYSAATPHRAHVTCLKANGDPC